MFSPYVLISKPFVDARLIYFFEMMEISVPVSIRYFILEILSVMVRR